MGRLLKLKEAHKSDTPVTCSVVWAYDGCHLATSCASDTEVLIHDMSAPPPGRSGAGVVSSPVVLRHHKEGVTAIALGPTSGPLASGSSDHSVKLCSFPGEFASPQILICLINLLFFFLCATCIGASTRI